MKKQNAFTMIEILIVVGIIGMLAALAIPNFIRARETSQLNSISNNLRIIEGAKDQYALEQKKGTGQTVTMEEISEYLKSGTVKSVVGETYDLRTIGTNTTATLPPNIKLATYPLGATITE